MVRTGEDPSTGILVVQHAESEGPGLLARALEDCRLGSRIVRPDRGDPVPRSAAGAPGVIVLGGPMAVYESGRFPHLRDEIALLADALARSVPVLGVCLGSQILAAAGGARVYRGPAKEIGWFPVSLGAEGRKDAVLGLLPEEAMVFHWHGDTFDLPRGATLLASSRLYAHQAFRLGPRAYGVQFHPEITVEMVDQWVSQPGPESGALGSAEGAARIRSEARRHVPPLVDRVTAMARALFGWNALSKTTGRGPA